MAEKVFHRPAASHSVNSEPASVVTIAQASATRYEAVPTIHESSRRP